MKSAHDILRLRLRRQLIERPARADAPGPAEVVQRLCAMQAQNYPGVIYAVGLRAGGLSALDVEAVIAEGRIVRTWTLRGTLHLTAPEDVRWMLDLLAPRAIAHAATRHKQLRLTEEVFERARELFVEALSGGRSLTRAESMALLESGDLATGGQRGYHILWMLAQEAILCIGPMKDNEQTFVLFDDWIPPTDEAPLEREEALARLAERYFEAHGPATLEDFEWWAGIAKSEARMGLKAVAENLRRIDIDGTEYWLPASVSAKAPASRPSIHLLPGYDEFMLGYTDRSFQFGEHPEAHGSTVSGNGAMSPTLVIDGQVAGVWKHTLRKDHVEIGLRTLRTLSSDEQAGIPEAAERYARFLGTTAVLRDWAGSPLR